MAWLAVDGAHVRLVVGAAFLDGDDVVGLVGAGAMADVAPAAIAVDDSSGSGLLGRAREVGASMAWLACPWCHGVVGAGSEVGAASGSFAAGSGGSGRHNRMLLSGRAWRRGRVPAEGDECALDDDTVELMRGPGEDDDAVGGFELFEALDAVGGP